MPAASIPFRAVIFDLFGTLVPPFPAERFERSLADMAAAVGADADAFTRLWITETVSDRTTGTFDSIAANVLHICRELGVEPESEEIEDAVRLRNEFTREVLQPRHDAVSTLHRIGDAGLGRGLVSDCSVEVPELWPTLPFAPLIDVPVFSCTAGAGKPDPRIFMMACNGLGVEPGECLYVGDGYSRELTGSSALGMTAVLIAVPGETPSSSHPGEGPEWRGERVESLSDVLRLLGLE